MDRHPLATARRPFRPDAFRPAARLLPPGPNSRRLPDPVSDDEVLRALRACPPHFDGASNPPTYTDLFFASTAAGTAVANSTTETSLLAGLNLQPTVPPNTLTAGRALRFKGWGLLSNTGTPTLTFKFYLNPTQGAASLAGANVGVTAAITTASGVTGKAWGFELDLIVRTPGQGAGAATLFCMGFVWSSAGFASPFEFTITPGAGDSATVTATLDAGVTTYFNASATWGAASASNTIALQGLEAHCWN